MLPSLRECEIFKINKCFQTNNIVKKLRDKKTQTSKTEKELIRKYTQFCVCIPSVLQALKERVFSVECLVKAYRNSFRDNLSDFQREFR